MSIEDEMVYFPIMVNEKLERIALDCTTVARLMELCDETHSFPAAMIAALVTDVIRDDFEAHHAPAGYSSEKPPH